MFKQTLPRKTRDGLALLGKSGLVSKFYLAGGSACALYLGHRLSIDLDFFTEENFSPKDLTAELSKLGEFSLTQEAKDTLLGDFEETKISFFKYPYSLAWPPEEFLKIKIAPLLDIGAMKLDAIATRGKKRDFIDLYFIAKIHSLEETLSTLRKKYGHLDYNYLHLAKSLTYFDDAEKEEMPKMLKEVSWEKIKQFFTQESIRLFEELPEK